MKNKSKRIIYTTVAIVIGISVVYGLSILGSHSEGPIEYTLKSIENTISDFEKNIIIDKKSKLRSEKLTWLKPYFSSTEDLKHPTTFLFGAYDNLSDKSFLPNINLEDTLHTQLPLIHIYSAWGSKSNQNFPRKEVNDIITLGSIPVITWEPWLVDFDAAKYPQLKPSLKRDKGGLRDIANGLYDSYLASWAKDARDIKTPILLRFGHEMNDPYRYPWGPQNNEPADFVAAWKHVHDLFSIHGAKNVIWIWGPHPAYGHFNEYYPGEKYVDYVGIGTLNYGPVTTWARWWSFDEIFERQYNELIIFQKPIILTEFASLGYGGDRSQWYAEALRNLPNKYPYVRGLLFFHFNADNTTTQQILDWTFINDKKIVKTIRDEVNRWNPGFVLGWRKD